jgi:membrane protein
MDKGPPSEPSPSRLAQRARNFLALLQSAKDEYDRDHARYFAVAMIYYALVSLEPLLLLLIAGLGRLHGSAYAAAAEQQVLRSVETRFGPELTQMLSKRLDWLQRESTLVMVLSLVGLMVTGSVLFHQLRLSFRSIWKQKPSRVPLPLVVLGKTFREQGIAFVMMGSAGLLLLAALGLFAAVQWLSGLFGNTPVFKGVASILPLIGPLLVFTLTFALAFKFLPPVRLHWRHVLPASMLCAAVWIVTAEILTVYSAYFGRLSTIGVIGAILALTLWMNLVSQVMFFGAELCKVSAARDGWVVGSADVTEPSRDVARTSPIERRVSEPRRRAG